MFHEKLSRRNVSADVKHNDDCEQQFFSVGKCFVVEALMEFFQIVDTKHKPTASCPHSDEVQSEEYRKKYITDALNKFLDAYVFENVGIPTADGVWCYSVNMLRSFLLLADIKDVVATGNGNACGNSCLGISSPPQDSINMPSRCLLIFCNAKFCCRKLKPIVANGQRQ